MPGKSQHCFTNKQDWVVCVISDLGTFSPEEVGDPEGEKTHLGPKLRGSWPQEGSHHQAASSSASQVQTKQRVRFVGVERGIMEIPAMLQKMASLWPTSGPRDSTHWPTPFHVSQDYTWEDHGYSLIQRLYPEGGQLLDEKFQAAYSLTYNTIAMHSGVDTSVLRRAIWNYIHCVFGIRWVKVPSSRHGVPQALHLSSQLFPFSFCLSFPFFLPILFFKSNVFLGWL